MDRACYAFLSRLDPIPIHLLYWMLEVCLDGPHGAHSALISQIRGMRGEPPILPDDGEWNNAIRLARRPIEAHLAQRYGHQRHGHMLYHQPPHPGGHAALGGQAQAGGGGGGGGGGGIAREGGGGSFPAFSDVDVDAEDPRIGPIPISPYFRWAMPVVLAARCTPWLVDVIEIGLACPAGLMLWSLLSLIDDKRGYWMMMMVTEIGVLSLPPSFLSWAYTRLVYCQLIVYAAALHMPYWAGDLLTPLQTCFRLALFVACCATLEVDKHAYALRWPRRRSNRCRPMPPTPPLSPSAAHPLFLSA
jgi:hypothetical protein